MFLIRPRRHIDGIAANSFIDSILDGTPDGVQQRGGWAVNNHSAIEVIGVKNILNIQDFGTIEDLDIVILKFVVLYGIAGRQNGRIRGMYSNEDSVLLGVRNLVVCYIVVTRAPYLNTYLDATINNVTGYRIVARRMSIAIL
ncbi:hypothetical protein ES703_121602 [subsurface metagenome]